MSPGKHGVIFFRHGLILLVTAAFCALALLYPIGGRTQKTALGPLASTAPPLFAPARPAAVDDHAVMNALRHDATLALGQLRGRTQP